MDKRIGGIDYFTDRKWERLFVGGTTTWEEKGFVNSNHFAGFAYAAIGMLPAMVKKIVDGPPVPVNPCLLHYPADMPVQVF